MGYVPFHVSDVGVRHTNMRKSNPLLDPSAAPIAGTIHALLIESGRHHVDVSLEAGLGRDYLRDLFRGKSQKPNHEDLVKITNILGAPISALSEQGAASTKEDRGNKPYVKEDVALLSLWGLLSKEGQDRALAEIAKLILKYPRRR